MARNAYLWHATALFSEDDFQLALKTLLFGIVFRFSVIGIGYLSGFSAGGNETWPQGGLGIRRSAPSLGQ